MNTAAADVPLLIRSDNSTSERRVNPSWTVSQFRARLEPITGVPASCQALSLRVSSSLPAQLIEAADEDAVQLAHWPLQPYAEIEVRDTRPPGLRTNYADVSAVAKYEMSADEYAARSDSVLAYKRARGIGRFDPAAPTLEQARIAASFREAAERGVEPGVRCRLLPDHDHRRGTVRFVGEVAEIAGSVGAWVGVELDEPTGKNDGCVQGARYFACKPNYGVFVRAERVEVGDFPVLDEFADDDDEF